MKDTELRGRVLQAYYDRRREAGPIGVEQIANVLPAVSIDEAARISGQLGEAGLVNWRPVNLIAGMRRGFGEIAAHGVDVIEGEAQPPIPMIVHDQSVHITGSSNVQIGSGNVQSVSVSIGKLIAAVDHSNATEAEKAQAKSLLQQVLSNKLVVALLGTIVSSAAQ